MANMKETTRGLISSVLTCCCCCLVYWFVAVFVLLSSSSLMIEAGDGDVIRGGGVAINWVQVCKELCQAGEGGILCNCDMIPLRQQQQQLN